MVQAMKEVSADGLKTISISLVQGFLIQSRCPVDNHQYLKSPNNILAKLPSVR